MSCPWRDRARDRFSRLHGFPPRLNLSPVPTEPLPACASGVFSMKMKKSRSGQAAETAPLPLSPQCSVQPESRKRTADELPYAIPAILFEGDESDPPVPAVGPVEECAPSPAAQAGHVELEDESNTPRLAVGPVEERAPSNAAQAAPDEGEGTGLPEAYGTRTLLLTAQAPHWLYAHWDIAREEQRQSSAPADGRQLVLRVYERAVSSSPTAQIQVQPDSREWFVHVPRSATQYVAELGCSSSGGLWQSLATSEVAVTPADGVSQDQRVEFATIEPRTHQALPPRRIRPSPFAAPPTPGGEGRGRSAALPDLERLFPPATGSLAAGSAAGGRFAGWRLRAVRSEGAARAARARLGRDSPTPRTAGGAGGYHQPGRSALDNRSFCRRRGGVARGILAQRQRGTGSLWRD